jgi:hypothetical protein
VHPKVLGADIWRTVRRLVAGGYLHTWTLAGGTGLALQLGHRVSEDLDFFRPGQFDPQALIESLSKAGPLGVQARAAGTLHATLGPVRISFLAAQAPLLYPGTGYRGLTIADPRDIAVMKVIAIGGRGSRKDFVDMYFYLKNGGALDTVLTLLRRRFARIDYNEYHLLKSLVFFEDAESEPMPRLLRRASWTEIKSVIVAEVKRLS